MISRKTAHRLAKEWFSSSDINNYGTLPSLIFRCEHMILTRHAYCQDDSRKIMDDLPPLLEFLKMEKAKYDSKPSYKTIQRIVDSCFLTEKAHRFLEVLPRITKTKNGSVLFIVFEEWDPISKYKYLSPLYSVWVWKKDGKPRKLYLDKLFSKQYVFTTKKDAQYLLRTIKSEY